MSTRDDSLEFAEKLDAFVRSHRRIVSDFGRSLANARQFLTLANRSLEREPTETVSMLEQIKEIDLLGHLSGQYEEYRQIAGFLLPPHSPVDDPELQGELAELQSKYEALLEEAEGQMETIEDLLSTLQRHH